MSNRNSQSRDSALEDVQAVLAKYSNDHPHALTKAYRHNSVSVRVRIVDTDFHPTSKFKRHDALRPYLDELSEETLSEISQLLLLTPKEARHSMASKEFDNPFPSPVP
jgi:hypothetical protein